MSAQDKVDGVRDSSATTRAVLQARLRDDKVVGAIAMMHPAIVALPSERRHLEARRVAMMAYTACAKNPALLKCSPQSVVASAVEAAQLGLAIDGVLGHAYLVPYVRTAQMQIGYRGFIALAYRSGEVERIYAREVREGDVFEHDQGTAPYLRHRVELDAQPGHTVGAYALCHLRGSSAPLFHVMSLAEILRHRDRSSGYKAFKSGNARNNPWETDFDAMASKTALRMLAKYMPSDTMQRAASRDEAVDHGRARTGDELELSGEMPGEEDAQDNLQDG